MFPTWPGGSPWPRNGRQHTGRPRIPSRRRRRRGHQPRRLVNVVERSLATPRADIQSLRSLGARTNVFPSGGRQKPPPRISTIEIRFVAMYRENIHWYQIFTTSHEERALSCTRSDRQIVAHDNKTSNSACHAAIIVTGNGGRRRSRLDELRVRHFHQLSPQH